MGEGLDGLTGGDRVDELEDVVFLVGRDGGLDVVFPDFFGVADVEDEFLEFGESGVGFSGDHCL